MNTKENIIGIMGAMPEEIDILKTQLTDKAVVTCAGRDYYLGYLGKQKVVITFSRWGKVAAAITTTTLINLFKIKKLIFTGVAGAVSAKLNVGDVILATQLYQHDMDATPLFPRYHIPLTNTLFFHTDDKLSASFEQTLKRMLPVLTQYIPANVLNDFAITAPKYQKGMIASGDQFVDNVEQYTFIEGTLAVEMEGAAVAQTCDDYHIPYAIIRIISDKSDQSAAIDFSQFIKEISAHYVKHLILQTLMNI